jgi:hypothetical protein
MQPTVKEFTAERFFLQTGQYGNKKNAEYYADSKSENEI